MIEKIHAWNNQIIQEFRDNNGDVVTANFGRSLVLLHSTGARTGEARVNPLRSVHDGNGTWLVVASAQGAPHNPDWYYNLIAHSDVEIETPDRGFVEVSAEVLIGAAREAAWRTFTAANPVFVKYQQETERKFPIIALHRREMI